VGDASAGEEEGERAVRDRERVGDDAACPRDGSEGRKGNS
jgi:hypothetical protein